MERRPRNGPNCVTICGRLERSSLDSSQLTRSSQMKRDKVAQKGLQTVTISQGRVFCPWFGRWIRQTAPDWFGQSLSRWSLPFLTLLSGFKSCRNNNAFRSRGQYLVQEFFSYMYRTWSPFIWPSVLLCSQVHQLTMIFRCEQRSRELFS